MTGDQDRIIEFITYGNADDGYGGTTVSETLVLKTFASCRQISSNRDVEQLQTSLNNAYQFEVKYRSGFTPTLNMVIKYAGRFHSITQIELNAERHKRYWILLAVDNGANQ